MVGKEGLVIGKCRKRFTEEHHKNYSINSVMKFSFKTFSRAFKILLSRSNSLAISYQVLPIQNKSWNGKIFPLAFTVLNEAVLLLGNPF